MKTSRWLWVLISLLSFGLCACGSKAPVSIVQQALEFQRSHLGVRQTLIGQELLPRYTQIQQVRVKRDRSVSLPTDTGSKLPAHQLSGTYTLSIRPPGERRSHAHKGEPFQLTVARASEDQPWLLAYPTGSVWSTVKFLPEIPQIPPAKTQLPPVSIPLELTGEEVPDPILKPLLRQSKDQAIQEDLAPDPMAIPADLAG